MDTLLTVPQVAEKLNCHTQTVYRNKELPRVEIPGVGVRYRESDLQEYVEKRTRKPLVEIPQLADIKIISLISPPASGSILSGGNSGMAKAKSKTRYNLGYGAIYQRITKNGKIRWYLDYRDANGKRIQKVAPHAATKEEAVLALQQEVSDEFDRVHGIKRERKKIKLKDFVGIYLEDYAKVAKKSWETDEYRLKKIKEFFKEVELRDISPLMVQKFRAYSLRNGAGESTVNREVTLLKKMFNVAIEERYLEQNPAKGIKMYSEMDMVRDRVLTAVEETRLFAELADHVKPFAFTSLHTGMRKGELFNLKWNNVDFENRIIKVEKTKSKKVRFIPINSMLFDALKRLEAERGENQLVFPFKNIQTAWENARSRAGIENLIFHDLRRAFGTRLLEAGVDIVTISKLFGHSNVLVTQRYLHPKDSLSKEAVESLVKKADNEKNLLHKCDTEKKEKFDKSVSRSICMN
jgi:excisionase family DNA binding protein